MVWFVAIACKQAIRKIRNWSSEITGAASMTCLLGIIGILVHSAVDFNLQIPANAALFYVMCTVAAAEPFLHPARKRKVVRSKPVEEILDQEALPQSATNF
jgi:hypothetical protein